MYKMYKMNSAHNYNIPDTHGKYHKPNLYEHIYPKIDHFIEFFSKKLGLPTIEKYLNKEEPNGKKSGKASNSLRSQDQIEN